MRGGSATFVLKDEAATLNFGRALAQRLPKAGEIPTVLLRAPLGSGKTTLVRGFVSALPGAFNAEVSSPSFNLANVYPTSPRTLHVDLYRLGKGVTARDLEGILDLGADIQEAFAGNKTDGTGETGTASIAILVEWAEYLPEDFLPADRLEIELRVSGKGRTALATAHGPLALAWLATTLTTSSQSFAS